MCVGRDMPPSVAAPVVPRPTAAARATAASHARQQSRYEGHAPLWKQPTGESILDPFIGFITRRWNEGCCNVAQLWRELVPLGFRGRQPPCGMGEQAPSPSSEASPICESIAPTGLAGSKRISVDTAADGGPVEAGQRGWTL